MRHEVERAVRELPLMTRAHVLEEAADDPRFWSYFAPLALSGRPGAAVDDDMRRALVNELEPSRFPESAGRWPALRRMVRGLAAETGRFAVPGPHEPGELAALAGFGDVWGDIAAVVSGIGSTAAAIYAARLKAKLAAAQAKALQPPAAPAPPPAAPPGPEPPPAAPPLPPPEGLPWYAYAAAAAGALGAGYVVYKAVARR